MVARRFTINLYASKYISETPPRAPELLDMIFQPEWMERGNCVKEPYFFDLEEGIRGQARKDKIETAKRLCKTCPVLAECKPWAKKKHDEGMRSKYEDDTAYPWTDIVVAGHYYPPYYISN